MTWEGIESWDELFERQLSEYREAVADTTNMRALRQIQIEMGGSSDGWEHEISRLESAENRARLAVVDTFKARR